MPERRCESCRLTSSLRGRITQPHRDVPQFANAKAARGLCASVAPISCKRPQIQEPLAGSAVAPWIGGPHGATAEGTFDETQTFDRNERDRIDGRNDTRRGTR